MQVITGVLRRAYTVQLMLVMFVVAALQGCAANLEQRAYAAYGTFVIVEEKVAGLTAPTSTLPRETQLKLIQGVERAQPVVDTLVTTLNQYEGARADFEAQRESQPSFMVVVNNLASWTTQAEQLVTQLVEALRGGK
jgi:hypothetical protein